MKKYLFSITIAILACCAQLFANDGTYYTSGNQLVPLMETDISVRKEVLTISILNNGFAKVDVYYEFWNPGKQTRQLTMGFEADPPYNADWKFHPNGVHPNISDFTVEMNGLRLLHKNAVCHAGAEKLDPVPTTKYNTIFDDNRIYEKDPEAYPEYWETGIAFAYVYYFTATFQPGLNKVHHTYCYRMSHGLGNPWDICYKLTPAGRWANRQIDDFTLIVRADNTSKHFIIEQKAFPQAVFAVTEGVGKIRNLPKETWQTPYLEFTLRNGAVQTHITNFKPQDELRIASGFVESKPFGHFYDPHYGKMPFFMANWAAEQNHQDLQFVKRVSRNLPYAYRGHVFKDKVLREFFESQWWYMPDPDYKDDDSDFTEVDRLYLKAEIPSIID